MMEKDARDLVKNKKQTLSTESQEVVRIPITEGDNDCH